MSKIDEAIQEMKEELAELEDKLAEKTEGLDDQAKQKATALIEKTENAIKGAIAKIEAAIDNFTEDEQFDEFLDKVRAKSREAVEFAKDKIDDLATKTSNQSLADLHDDVMAEFDKLKENEYIKKTADFLKEIGGEINEFFEKPEVKETINKAKVTTINVAEKGVEGLKKILKPEEVEKESKED